MKMSFSSPPSPAWSWSMMRIVMLRCNGDQVVLRCTWKSDQVILRCKTSSTRWKDPQRLNLRLPLQFYQWNRFFCDLDHVGELGLYDDDQHHSHNVDLDLDVQVEELVLHLPPRCLGSTWSLAYGTDQHGEVMMIINSDGHDDGNGHYCHDHNDDQSHIDHNLSSSESNPSSSPIFYKIAT